MRRRHFAGLGVIVALFLAALTPSRSVSAQTPAATAVTPAAELRVMLVGLLTEHTALMALAMHKGYEDAPDFAATTIALEANTQALGTAVHQVYGDAAVGAFLGLWREHIDAFLLYTDGSVRNDTAAQQQARQRLDAYVEGVADLFAGANPNLPRAAVADVFTIHVSHLLGQLDAYAAQDFTRTYAIIHAAHMHSTSSASALAAAIATQFPARFPGDPTAPAVEFRVMLVDMHTEHGFLSAVAEQKAYLGAPDLPALLAQLDENSQAHAAMIRTLYGERTATAFLGLWREHIGFYMEYATGTARNDQAARLRAAQGLVRFADDLATLFSIANPFLAQELVLLDYTVHVEQTITVLDSYAAGLYGATLLLLHDGHMHLIGVASRETIGILSQFPEIAGGGGSKK